MNDFSVHRIIGRGGFGEVYGCRKADTGKMYAMKVSGQEAHQDEAGREFGAKRENDALVCQQWSKIDH